LKPDEQETNFGTSRTTITTPDTGAPPPAAPSTETLTPPPIPGHAPIAPDATPSVGARAEIVLESDLVLVPDPPAPPAAPVATPAPAHRLPVLVHPDDLDEPEPPGYWKWALGGATLGAIIAALLTVFVIQPSRSDPADATLPASAALDGVEPSRTMEGELLTEADLALARANLDDARVLPALVAGTPYARSLYRLSGWPDTDDDCQDARTEVLIAEATGPVEFRADGCAVVTGEWIDPFSGVALTHTNTLEINHMVPLAEAHRAGAWEWSDAERAEFATDLQSTQTLAVVSTPIDQGKGDRRPDQWRPPLRSAWCGYAVDWIGVKTRWDLAFVQREVDALSDMLDTCVS